MIKSMTGFGRCLETVNGRDILVEIKSVNHRYYEFSARVPRSYGFLEEKLKTFLQGRISRGKVDVGVTVYNVNGDDEKIEVNKTIAKEYVDALRSANAELGLEDDLTLSRIMRLPDIFNVRKAQEDEDAVWNDVKIVAEKALDNFMKVPDYHLEKAYVFSVGNVEKVGSVMYLPIYMCYLLKERQLGRMIVELDLDGL